MKGVGFDSPSIWQGGRHKPRRAPVEGKRLSPTRSCWTPSNCHLPHCDLADRFLAATAQLVDLTLVTSDHNLLEFCENPDHEEPIERV